MNDGELLGFAAVGCAGRFLDGEDGVAGAEGVFNGKLVKGIDCPFAIDDETVFVDAGGEMNAANPMVRTFARQGADGWVPPVEGSGDVDGFGAGVAKFEKDGNLRRR